MMLYEEIRRRCRMYHEGDGYSYDESYACYRKAKDQDKWNNPTTLDCDEVKRLVRFANKWKSRVPKNDETIRRLLNNLKNEVPRLNTLQNATLLDVKFDESTMQMIARCFDIITGSPVRNDGVTVIRRPVGISKMLHVAINPNLFVMWDSAIQGGHGPMLDTGYEYAHIFLPKMQRIAKQAVNQVMKEEGLSCADAIQSFTDHCEKNNSLAKIIDEYNYAKYTAEWRL